MGKPSPPKSYRRLVGLAAVVIAAAVGLLLVTNWPQRPPEPVPLPEAEPQPGVTITRPVLKHLEDGQLAWQAQLRELHIGHGGQMIEAKGLEEAIIYSKAGAPLLRVTADKISGHTGRRDFEVTDNVRVVSYRAAIITTSKLSWNQEQQLIKCPEKVTLKSKQAIFTTTELDYFVAEDLIKSPGPVRMYSGENLFVGQNLQYNVATGNFQLQEGHGVFHAEEAKEKLREIRELVE